MTSLQSMKTNKITFIKLKIKTQNDKKKIPSSPPHKARHVRCSASAMTRILTAGTLTLWSVMDTQLSELRNIAQDEGRT